jgi:hypothetical protein
MQATSYDDSEWTSAETGLLAREAFATLDNTDYGEYLDGSAGLSPEQPR